MTDDGREITVAADALRRDFDESFARPPLTRDEAFEDVLAIRVAGQPFALALVEVAGVYAGRRVVPLPGPARALLGVAAIRGAVVQVWDLRVLLGLEEEGPPPGWMVVARGHDSVALAFDQLEAQQRAPAAAVAHVEDASTTRHVAGTVDVGGSVRPLLRLASVMAAVPNRQEGP